MLELVYELQTHILARRAEAEHPTKDASPEGARQGESKDLSREASPEPARRGRRSPRAAPKPSIRSGMRVPSESRDLFDDVSAAGPSLRTPVAGRFIRSSSVIRAQRAS